MLNWIYIKTLHQLREGTVKDSKLKYETLYCSKDNDAEELL